MPDYSLRRKSIVSKFQYKRNRQRVYEKVLLTVVLICELTIYVIYVLLSGWMKW